MKRLQLTLWSLLFGGIALALVAFASRPGPDSATPISALDYWLYDFEMRARGPLAPSPEIILVTIESNGDRDIDDVPPALYYSHYAKALRALSAAGAKVVALYDLPLRSYSALAKDEAGLDAAVSEVSRNGTPIVVGAEARSWRPGGSTPEGMYKSIAWPTWLHAARPGVEKPTLDRDGKARRQKLFYESNGVQYPAFALATWDAFRGATSDPSTALADFPRSRNGGIYINYVGPAVVTFPRIRFSDVLQHAEANDQAWLEDRFRGKAVLLGTYEPAGDDRHTTPWSRRNDLKAPPIPTLEIHANTLDTLLRHRALAPAPTWWIVLWLVLATFGVSFLGAQGARLGLWAFLFILLGSAVISHAGFREGMLFPYLMPTIGAFLAFTFAVVLRTRVLRRKELKLRELFRTFVSPEVLRRLEREADTRLLDGEERVVTVMFTDIRGFTQISETRTPADVLNWLRRYHAAMAEIVVREGGTIDKFTGDGLVALFGAPLDAPADGAIDATRTGLAMARRLVSLNEEFERDGLPATRVGIGIHTGRAIVGVFGSNRKREYTAIGDTVNVAARIEGESKRFLEPTIDGEPGDVACVVMTEETLSRISNTGMAAQFRARPLGEVAVRGRLQTMQLFTVTERSLGEEPSIPGVDTTAPAK